MRYLNKHEWNLASRFLFLSMTLTVIRHDLGKLEQNSPFKITEPYTQLLQEMEQQAIKEREELIKEMNKEELEVQALPNSHDMSFTSYLFICKGREEKRNYFNPAIRRKVSFIFEELLAHALTAKTNQEEKLKL
ncbi:hypothetical protein [Gracilibacillus phocaeensis]|uniref:hypothetical protein n=1 Tax=Gracilibacillus phocaeensis TaxID=2042304 RepID=UPI00102F855C|nr:hypothetical protein [Gracilibacillus phocaeensis]